MRLHLNPSSAHRWVPCPASVHMAYNNIIPDDENRNSADEGIQAHVVAHDILLGKAFDRSVIDPEMIESGELYADTIRSMVDISKWNAIIEGYVGAPSIHKELGGVPDCRVYDKEANVLHIFDYKYGHRYVDAFENWQLISYAVCILDNLNVQDDPLINMVIVQPRSYCKEGPVRVWAMYLSALKPYFERLKDAATKTQLPDVPCVTGGHCHYCPAAHGCVALQQAAYTACDITLNGEYQLADNDLGKEYDLLLTAQDRLKSRIAGIEADIEYRIRTGKSVPGYTLEQTTGREGWKVDEQQVIDTGELMGIDLKKINVITPAQARKKGLNEEVVAMLSERKPGSMKIAKIKNYFG